MADALAASAQHIKRTFAKTGARDREQAMRYAYEHGYADPAPAG